MTYFDKKNPELAEADELYMPQPATRLDDKIYIGNTVDSHDPELLKTLGVNSILSLDGSHLNSAAADYNVQKISNYSLIDGAGNDYMHIVYILKSLDELVKKHHPVLINCNAGKSRAVSIAAAYKSYTTGRDLTELIDEIKTVRSTAVSKSLLATVSLALEEMSEQ